MRKWLREMVGLAMAVSAGLGAFWTIWFIWGPFFKELFSATLHITAHTVIWAGGAGLVIAGIAHIAQKRHSWMYHTAYWAATRLLNGRARSRVQMFDEAFSARGDRKGDFVSYYVFNTSDHWLAKRVEEWGLRILHVLVWPLVIVGLTHSVQGSATTVGGYAATIAAMVAIFAICGVKLRNLFLFVMIAAWLVFALRTWGSIEGEAQAAVIGFGFVLWSAWREWQRRITNPTADDDGPAPQPSA